MKTKKKDKRIYLPKKINLLGRHYKIKMTDCKCKKCDSENAGTIDFNKGIIELHKNLDKKEVEYVLFHELAHFFADYYRLENSEIFADAFTKYIISVIRQIGYKRVV